MISTEKPRKSGDMSDMVHRIKTEEAKGREKKDPK